MFETDEDKHRTFIQLLRVLDETRGIKLSLEDVNLHSSRCLLGALKVIIEYLQSNGHERESNALISVLDICDQPAELGGLGLSDTAVISPEQTSEILFLVSAWLEALNSADRAKARPIPLAERPQGRRGMTLSEKIFALHDVEQRGFVVPGQLIRVDVDWVIASEASWAGMEWTYNRLGKPGIFRNDRFWLAGDHVVDPRVNKIPKVQSLIDASERAKRVFKMTDYQGMNYTILHTEFYRERAQPGMLIIGSDSHTCSSGALGCLAIGLGAADVTLPLVTGETWFKVPESVNIRLVGSTMPGIGGKDVILYILQQLKRNTVASDRIVEFTGPGVRHLSSDARFAISNMTTEFGGITGVFVPDQITHTFIEKRRFPHHKNASIYFRPDEEAQYAEVHEIDLGNVRSFLARYPRPDDVVPVTDYEGMALDGCFISACTTAEEDLILGALVLEQGLMQGLKPVTRGKRKVVPGSMPIMRRLRELGLLDIYEDAGFEIGVPGCSYCVGMSADQAAPGEVWISSQNRNFENRMGKGSIGHLGSAATVAASSFEMKLVDPHHLLMKIDLDRWRDITGASAQSDASTGMSEMVYLHPPVSPNARSDRKTPDVDDPSQQSEKMDETSSSPKDFLKGKIQRLGDFIDTDALAPAEFLVGMRTSADSGAHCLEYTHPEFRRRAREGFNIVVAGKGFGCGSSREQAVMTLLGCGVQCVIAKSFAFIFQRNMPNLGLLGIAISDESFYEIAQDGEDISIYFGSSRIYVREQRFGFQLSQMEKELFDHGGIASAFRRFGNRLFSTMTEPKGLRRDVHKSQEVAATPHSNLQW